MTVTVRAAKPDDAPTIAEYNRRMAFETEKLELDAAVLARGVARALADPAKARYWVAESGGQVAGQLMITLEWSDWRDGWIWWIQSVYVAPEARRHGVLAALYAHVREAARAAGDVRAIRLYVEQENQIAHRAYERLGMQRTHYLVYEEGL
jgi:GNAT superfamily N-acetyltransferase